jgi:hypothetical protein
LLIYHTCKNIIYRFGWGGVVEALHLLSPTKLTSIFWQTSYRTHFSNDCKRWCQTSISGLQSRKPTIIANLATKLQITMFSRQMLWVSRCLVLASHLVTKDQPISS